MELSARKVGPKVYTRDSAHAAISACMRGAAIAAVSHHEMCLHVTACATPMQWDEPEAGQRR
jgi:hypothetical protein